MRVKIILFSLVWLIFFVIPIFSSAEADTNNELQIVTAKSADDFYDLIDKEVIPHCTCIAVITDSVPVLKGAAELTNKLKQDAQEKGADILVLTGMVDKVDTKSALGVVGLFVPAIGHVLKESAFVLQLKEPSRNNLIEQIKKHKTNNVYETYSALHYLDKQLMPEDKALLNDVMQKTKYPALSQIASAELSKLNQDVSQNNEQQQEQQVQTVKVKSKYKSVELRSEPSAKASVIENLPGGMEVLKLSENAEWVQIRLDMDDGSKEDGWLKKDMVDDPHKEEHVQTVDSGGPAISSARINNIAGSTWDGTGTGPVSVLVEYTFENDGTLSYRYFDKDTLVARGETQRTGTWEQTDNRVYMQMNKRFVEYNGIISGNHMEGTLRNKLGLKKSWSADRKAE